MNKRKENKELLRAQNRWWKQITIKVNYSIKQQRLLERTGKQNETICYLQKTYYLKTGKG